MRFCLFGHVVLSIISVLIGLVPCGLVQTRTEAHKLSIAGEPPVTQLMLTLTTILKYEFLPEIKSLSPYKVILHMKVYAIGRTVHK